MPRAGDRARLYLWIRHGGARTRRAARERSAERQAVDRLLREASDRLRDRSLDPIRQRCLAVKKRADDLAQDILRRRVQHAPTPAPYQFGGGQPRVPWPEAESLSEREKLAVRLGV